MKRTSAQDVKKESYERIAAMARKKGTANDWVNSVLEGAIRSKFMTPSEREAQSSRHNGETTHQRELRLSQLYDSNASSKLVRRRARVNRPPKAVDSKTLSKKSFNPYGTLDGGPLYEPDDGPQDQSIHVDSWRVGYRNSTTMPSASPLAPNSRVWLERSMGKTVISTPHIMDQVTVSDPWVQPLKGSPHMWPKDSTYANGFQLKQSVHCQPYAPSSRLSNMSYAHLHTKRPPVPHAHEHSMSNTLGPPSSPELKTTVPHATTLTKRSPGHNPQTEPMQEYKDYKKSPEAMARTKSPPRQEFKWKDQTHLSYVRDPSKRSPAQRERRRSRARSRKASQATTGTASKGSPSRPSTRSDAVSRQSKSTSHLNDNEMKDSLSEAMDGDTYVMEGYERRPHRSVFDNDDDDRWTWSSAIEEPVRRVSPRLQRWQRRQQAATAELRESMRRKRAESRRLARVATAPTSIAAKRSGHRNSTLSATSSMASFSTASSASKKQGGKKMGVLGVKGGLKYWTNFTVMYSRKEDAKGLKEKAQRRAKEREVRSTTKWRELGVLWGYMRMPSNRKAGTDELSALYQAFRKACAEDGTDATVSRDRFWQVVSATELPLLNANRLYSGFDVDRRDEMDIRRFIASLRLFKKQNEPLVDKFAAIYDIYSLHAATENLRRADVVALLQTTSDNELEVDLVDKLAQRAMNRQLGTKSLWAVDVSRSSFCKMLKNNEMLTDCLERQYAATVGSAANPTTHKHRRH